jgi:hypothetical protein
MRAESCRDAGAASDIQLDRQNEATFTVAFQFAAPPEMSWQSLNCVGPDVALMQLSIIKINIMSTF